MPKQHYAENEFKLLEVIIEDHIAHGNEVQYIGNNLYKIVGNTTVLYWRQFDDEIIVGCQLYVINDSLFSINTSKNQKYIGKPPFASNLYIDILKDSGASNIISNSFLNGESLKMWKYLFHYKNKIMIYDILNPIVYYNVYSQEEMEKYINYVNYNFKRWHYVLGK